MRHLFERWPTTGRRPAFVTVLVSFAVVSAGLLWTGSRLTHDDAPRGLVSLQLAGSHERAADVVEPWRASGDLHLAGFGLGLDMLYLITYGVLLAVLAALAAGRARRRGRAGLASAAVVGGYAAWMAATLDAAENALQVPIVADPTAGVPSLVLALASAKFALLAATIVVTIVAASFPRKA